MGLAERTESSSSRSAAVESTGAPCTGSAAPASTGTASTHPREGSAAARCRRRRRRSPAACEPEHQGACSSASLVDLLDELFDDSTLFLGELVVPGQVDEEAVW